MTNQNQHDPHSMNHETDPASDGLTFSSEPCKPLSRPKGEAPFKDSWEAEAYALGNLLVKLNHVTAKEWMDLMAESIQEAQSFGDPDTGATYYNHWCRSLERFCFKAGLSQPSQHREILELWKKAISNTPHGVPLVLENAFLTSEQRDGPDAHSEHRHTSPTQPECNAPSLTHGHSHERPPTPPATYYAPIAKQILKSTSV